jgi:tRNA (guanine37-N1)-methyltransferase
LKFGCISLFPSVFDSLSEYGVIGKAAEAGLIEFGFWNPRDFSQDVHRRVDDKPYGGGAGMVLQVQPLVDAIKKAKETWPTAKVIYLAPDGKTFTQQVAVCCAKQATDLIFIAGRYEGIDERAKAYVDEVWSIGDYVLTGGELAAMVAMDAIARLLPGVLGHEESAANDTFSVGLLEHPHYTRPRDFEGMAVPEVLLSGDHQAIARWRQKQALGKTWQVRPDLLEKYVLKSEEQDLLQQYIDEFECDKEQKK